MGVGILIPVRKPAGGQELNINTRTSLKRRHIRNIKLERFPPQVACQHGMPLGSCGFPRQLKTQFPAHRPTPQQYLPTECTRERTRCNGFIADLSSSRYNLSLCCYLRPAPRNGTSVTSPPGMSPILLVITACLMWRAELANDGCGLAGMLPFSTWQAICGSFGGGRRLAELCGAAAGYARHAGWARRTRDDRAYGR